MVGKFRMLMYYSGNCSLATWKLRYIQNGEIIAGLGGGLPIESYYDSNAVVYPPSGSALFSSVRAYYKSTLFPTSEGWATTNPPNACNGLSEIIEDTTVPTSLVITKVGSCYYKNGGNKLKITCGTLSKDLHKYLSSRRLSGLKPIYLESLYKSRKFYDPNRHSKVGARTTLGTN